MKGMIEMKNICECCEKEVIEELEERVMWNGKVCLCCEECCQEIDEDNKVEEVSYDDYMADIMHDEMMLGLR